MMSEQRARQSEHTLRSLVMPVWHLHQYTEKLARLRLTFLLWRWDHLSGVIVREIHQGRDDTELEEDDVRGRPLKWTPDMWRKMLGSTSGQDGDMVMDSSLKPESGEHELAKLFNQEKIGTNGYRVTAYRDPFRRVIVGGLMALFRPHRTTYAPLWMIEFAERILRGVSVDWGLIFHKHVQSIVQELGKPGPTYLSAFAMHLYRAHGLLTPKEIKGFSQFWTQEDVCILAKVETLRESEKVNNLVGTSKLATSNSQDRSKDNGICRKYTLVHEDPNSKKTKEKQWLKKTAFKHHQTSEQDREADRSVPRPLSAWIQDDFAPAMRKLESIQSHYQKESRLPGGSSARRLDRSVGKRTLDPVPKSTSGKRKVREGEGTSERAKKLKKPDPKPKTNYRLELQLKKLEVCKCELASQLCRMQKEHEKRNINYEEEKRRCYGLIRQLEHGLKRLQSINK